MDNPYQFDIAIDINIPKNIKSTKSASYTPVEVEKLKHIFSVLNIKKKNKRKRAIISFLGKRKFSEI